MLLFWVCGITFSIWNYVDDPLSTFPPNSSKTKKYIS